MITMGRCRRVLVVPGAAALIVVSSVNAGATTTATTAVGASVAPVVASHGASGYPKPAPPQLLLPDLDGTPIAPTGKQKKALAAAQGLRSPAPGKPAARTGSPEAVAVPSAIAGYNVSNDEPKQDVALSWWPYGRSQAATYDDGATRDSSGVWMMKLGGKLYNHPVGQAQDGIIALESFRVTRDPKYLNRAAADGSRLVDTRVESRGGWFYPYPFSWALHGYSSDVLAAPWYSAMAQGQALTLFVRLNEITNNPAWRTAADSTFRAIDLPVGTNAEPAVSFIDSNNQLWLEEYAHPDPRQNDRTWNGFLFAAWGVWDYWRLSGSADARMIFKGSMSSLRRYSYDGVRRTYWASAYCLKHAVIDTKYHQLVTEQYLYMFALTGSSSFAIYSDTFRNDYSSSTQVGNVIFAAGGRTGYTFDSAGNIISRKSITLGAASSAPAAGRKRIKGRGYYYKITAGMLSGYWVLEAAPYEYMKGFVSQTAYPYERKVTYPPGKTTGWQTTYPDGVMSHALTINLASAASATTDTLAVINGERFVRITSGSLDGRWVKVSALTMG